MSSKRQDLDKFREFRDVSVDEEIRVPWSNGAGFSLYRIVDDANGPGPHQLKLIGEYEYTAGDTCEPLPGRKSFYQLWQRNGMVVGMSCNVHDSDNLITDFVRSVQHWLESEPSADYRIRITDEEG